MAVAFVQNPHDHPLFVVYGGEVGALADTLEAAFDPGAVTKVDLEDATAAMGPVMGIHFQAPEKEYLFLAKLSNGELMCAVNHRYHDVASLGAMLSGTRSRPCYVADGVVKRPPGPPPDMMPARVASATLTTAQLDSLKKEFSLTRNEAAFLTMCMAISEVCEQNFADGPQRVMCLHSLRKDRGEVGTAGGDFSSFVRPLVLEPGKPLRCDAAGVSRVRDYFEAVRSGAAVLSDPDEVQEPFWMFDSWVGSGACCPGRASVSPTLIGLFSVVCRDTVLAVENADRSVDLHLFSLRDGYELKASADKLLDAVSEPMP